MLLIENDSVCSACGKCIGASEGVISPRTSIKEELHLCLEVNCLTKGYIGMFSGITATNRKPFRAFYQKHDAYVHYVQKRAEKGFVFDFRNAENISEEIPTDYEHRPFSHAYESFSCIKLSEDEKKLCMELILFDASSDGDFPFELFESIVNIGFKLDTSIPEGDLKDFIISQLDCDKDIFESLFNLLSIAGEPDRILRPILKIGYKLKQALPK